MQNYTFFPIFANKKPAPATLTTGPDRAPHTITMEKLEKKYYKIREVAEMLGLPASTLRFWESRFTIIKPHRNDKGTRFYTPSDIEKIRLVYYLVKEKGLKLEAAQEQIRHNHSNVSRRAQAIDRLHSIRNTLQSLLDATRSLR